MMDRAVHGALRRLGARRTLVDTCPVCGHAVTPAHDRVRAWQGKYAHRGCAHYVYRRRGREAA
ncbi:MAG: hypothetical protein ACRDJ9_30860 [Dehalococcoidia bacterium]